MTINACTLSVRQWRGNGPLSNKCMHKGRIEGRKLTHYRPLSSLLFYFFIRRFFYIFFQVSSPTVELYFPLGLTDQTVPAVARFNGADAMTQELVDGSTMGSIDPPPQSGQDGWQNSATSSRSAPGVSTAFHAITDTLLGLNWNGRD